MTDVIVTIRWETRCMDCGHVHVDEVDVDEGLEYAPPPVPDRCDECGYQLSRHPSAWGRRFKITDSMEARS